jgi:hypothetical protein
MKELLQGNFRWVLSGKDVYLTLLEDLELIRDVDLSQIPSVEKGGQMLRGKGYILGDDGTVYRISQKNLMEIPLRKNLEWIEDGERVKFETTAVRGKLYARKIKRFKK